MSRCVLQWRRTDYRRPRAARSAWAITSTPPKLLGLRAGSCSDMSAAPTSNLRVSRGAKAQRCKSPEQHRHRVAPTDYPHIRASRSPADQGGGLGRARQRGTVPQGEYGAARGPGVALCTLYSLAISLPLAGPCRDHRMSSKRQRFAETKAFHG